MSSHPSTSEAPRVLVTPRALTRDPEPVAAMLDAAGYQGVFANPGEQPSSERLGELLVGCIGWLAGVERIEAQTLRGAPSLRVISRFGSGVSNVDLGEAERLGISVRAATGANAQSVAELALALTLNCLRGITEGARSVSSGGWERQEGREIQGIDVLVVGYGAIGRRYADAMSRLGATVTVFDPYLPEDESLPSGISRVRGIGDALGNCDVVSLHCPPAADPIIGAAELQHCKPRLIVINTARSELVDDAALLTALQSGAVGSYAVDAFDQEPPRLTPLLTHPRVVATPHLGAYTEQAIEQTLRESVWNLTRALATSSPLIRIPLGASPEATADSRPVADALSIRWLGQAGFLIKTRRGRTILIDPYLSDVLAEKYAGTMFPHQRMIPPPIRPEDLPRIDLVIATHGHTDHLDPGTVSVIARQQPEALFIIPHRIRGLGLDRGIPEERLLTARGGDIVQPFHDVRIHAIESAHEDLDIDAGGSAYLGYVIDCGEERIYHSGDCVPYPSLARRIAALSPTIGLLPVNGRDSLRRDNGIPGNFTLSEAVELCELAGVPSMVAHHWGMFDFNTVSEQELEEARRAYSGPVSWYIPDLSAYLTREPLRADQQR